MMNQESQHPLFGGGQPFEEAMHLAQQEGSESHRRVADLAARHPDNVPLNLLLGMLLVQCNELEQALSVAERVFTGNPEFFPARLFLARLYLKTDRVGEISRLVRDPNISLPHLWGILRTVLDGAIQKGEEEAARNFAERLLQIVPCDESARQYLSRLALERGDFSPPRVTTVTGPLVTAVVVSSGGYLQGTLRSLAEQTYRPLRIVVADTMSTRPDAHESFRRDLHAPEGTAVLFTPGAGVSKLRQQLLEESKSELVLFCDDGAYLEPYCIERLARTLLSSEDAATVSATEIGQLSLDAKLNGRTPPARCMLLKKSAVAAAGGIPQGYRRPGLHPAAELSHRLAALNYRMVVEPQATVFSSGETPAPHGSGTEDELLFSRRVSRINQEGELRKLLQSSPLRVLIFYDVVGWAWWHRAKQIARYSPPHIQISSQSFQQPFDHTQYDYFLVFDDNIAEALVSPVPAEKLIVGTSFPKILDRSTALVARYGCVAGVVNNSTMFKQVAQRGNYFCCQNGVDTELFSPSPNPPAKLTACWVGNSHSEGEKGVELIREACREADVELIVHDVKHGASPLSQEQLRDQVYHRANVFICASRWEGTPNPALEALSCGLAVISTRVGNMVELIEHGYNGALVDRSAAAIRDALIELKKIPLNRLSENARCSVMFGWSWRDQVKKYTAMFESLVASRELGDDR